MTKDIAVTEVAQERVGEHIDQQATECRADNGNVILNAVRCAEILQLEHLVSKHAADNADDEFKDKGGDGIARITGHDIGQSKADGTSQATGNAVQHQGGQCGKGVAQVERRTGAQHVGNAEKLIRNKAERSHNTDGCNFLGGEFGFAECSDQDTERHNNEQQEPHNSSRHG